MNKFGIAYIFLTATILFTLPVFAANSTISIPSCPLYPNTPVVATIATIINEIKFEDILGACALSALNNYNNTGVLKALNITINMTELEENFAKGNPLLPSTDTTNAILANSTVLNIATPGTICLKITPESPNANPTAQNIHVHKCTPGWLQNSMKINVTNPNTTFIVIPPLLRNNTNTSINFNEQNSSNLQNSPIGQRDPVIIRNASNSHYVGYGALSNISNSVSKMEGSWIVTPALPSPTGRESSQWIGFGGLFPDVSLVQLGTDSCYGQLLGPCGNLTGKDSYDAWFEYGSNVTKTVSSQLMVIKGGVEQPFFVTKGDIISAFIQFDGNITTSAGELQEFTMTLVDKSQKNETSSVSVSLRSPRISAEWIDERPPRFLCVFHVYCIPEGYYNLTNFVNASYGFSNTHAAIDSANIGGIEGLPGKFNDSITNYAFEISGSNDFSDNATVSPVFSDSFKILNFRNFINTSNQTVAQSKILPIRGGARGGTGNYLFKWLVKPYGSLGGYTNATVCIANSTNVKSTCNLQTPFLSSGRYFFVLSAQDADVEAPNPLEIVNSSPINITVRPSVISFPITITNNQGSTSAPFQQMIRVDSASIHGINQNWNNVEFTTGQNATGSQLQAWVESGATNSSTDTVVWVKFPGGLPSGTTTIYMDMMPNPVMSADGPTGEAPQLSPTYAQYDNGQNVFNFYDNFAGTSLDSNWATETASLWSGSTATPTYSVNDGFSSSTNGGTIYGTRTVPLGSVVDAYGTYDLTGIGFAHFDGISDLKFNASFWQAQQSGSAVYGTLTSLDGCCQRFTSLYGGAPITGVFSMYLTNPSSATYQLNYTDAQTLTVSPSLPYPEHIVLITDGNNGQLSGSFFNQWIRVRSAPPSGIMPAVTVDPSNLPVTTSTTTTSTTTSSISTTSVFVTGSTSSSTTPSTTTIA